MMSADNACQERERERERERACHERERESILFSVNCSKLHFIQDKLYEAILR